MNKIVKILGVSVVLVCVLAVGSFVMAEKAEAPAAAPAVASKVPTMPPPLELRKTGIINVTKDASGKVKGIKLVVTSYNIILDEGSKQLESMDGQKVRVKGTFSMQDGQRCFTVKSVEPVASAKKKTSDAAKPAKKAVEKPDKTTPKK